MNDPIDTIIHDRKAWRDFNRGVEYEGPMSPEWAVERARHYVERREALMWFRFAWVLLVAMLMWAALVEGAIWLLS